MAGALDGIRVLDLTIFQQGSYPGAMLADLGADVIKVEGPDLPDPGRYIANYDTKPYNAFFHSLNRGKRAICIDLKDERGRKAFYQLAKAADVFLTNFRRGALQRLGCDYETLSRLNPRIVYARASGYGPKGPDADLGGMDILAQARGGMMSVTGDPGAPPRMAGLAVADHVGAITLAYGIMTALFHRERTGEGQEVDASLLGAQLCIQTHPITYALWSGEEPARYHVGRLPTWDTYEAADGKWFVLGMNRDSQWEPFCTRIGRPEWITDERYATQEGRLSHYSELHDSLQNYFKGEPAEHWISFFAEADLLAALVREYSDLPNDPQIRENEYIVDVPRPDGGEPMPMVGIPVHLSKTPGGPKGMGPEFGQHTEEVLLEAGFTWEQLTALREAGVIGPRLASEAAPWPDG